MESDHLLPVALSGLPSSLLLGHSMRWLTMDMERSGISGEIVGNVLE